MRNQITGAVLQENIGGNAPPRNRGAKSIRIEAQKVPSVVDYGRGYTLSIRLGVWGSVVSSRRGVRGGAPAGNSFWRILQAEERPWYNCLQLHTAAVSNTFGGQAGKAQIGGDCPLPPNGNAQN